MTKHERRVLGLTEYQASRVEDAKRLVRQTAGYEIHEDVVTVQAIKIARALPKQGPTP